MVEKEKRPVKPLKVTTISGLDIGPEELKEKQRSDMTLKDLVSKPVSKGKPQFVVKKDILYRKYTSKQGDTKIQLVVPTEMREKVLSVAHDRLLAGHRGAAKTLSRAQQEFYWRGVHEFVNIYVASCDLCQRNVSKGTVPKAPMGKLSLISTPFSTICVDLIGSISPTSDGYRSAYLLKDYK